MKEIDPQKTTRKIVSFLKSTFRRGGFTQALVAVSGGVDSATSLALTARALGVECVHPVLLPYGSLNKTGTSDALKFISSLKIPSKNIHIINIQPFVDPIVLWDPSMDVVRRGNIMARIRMIVLYDLTKKIPALVVGTENKTEHLLGYYTRFGDEASDIEPLRHLYKSQVYALARHLHVPDAILLKPPTAGLWKGQTDEEELGFSYEFADEILTAKKKERRIEAWTKKGRVKSSLPYCMKRMRVVSSHHGTEKVTHQKISPS